VSGDGAVYDSIELEATLVRDLAAWEMDRDDRVRMLSCVQAMIPVLDECAGETLQERWDDFEARVWPAWQDGDGRRLIGERWRWALMALVFTRRVRPSWTVMVRGSVMPWVVHLPADDTLPGEVALLRAACEKTWVSDGLKQRAVALGVRMLLVEGHHRISEITDLDMDRVPTGSKGLDVIDAALCQLGVLDRTAKRGVSRRHRAGRRTPSQMIEASDIPERFREVTVLYLTAYSERISDTYATLLAKRIALAHLWRYLDEQHPEVASSSEVTPLQVRGFIAYANERARQVRLRPAEGDTTTAHQWLSIVRTFFADLSTWAAEPGSPFAGLAPAMVPLTRHDLVNIGFEKARRRGAARMTSTVIELERQMPNIRAFALTGWQEAEQALAAAADDTSLVRAERERFWDWAVLELLVESGLRVEEALELTSLDILKRRLGDGRLYYMLHVKPSKFDRARVIPIGDGLGRVLAEIVRHVKVFYGTDHVPACDHWDQHERRLLPRAPTFSKAPAIQLPWQPATSVPGWPAFPPAPEPAEPTVMRWGCGRMTADGCSPRSISTTEPRCT
jgi:integrase